MEIVPALLESNPQQFRDRLDKLAEFAKRIQVDFNDGSFAGFISVKPEEMAKDVLQYKDQIAFEAHLMVQKPYDLVPKLVESGFRKIIIQSEIEDNMRSILEQLRLENVLVGLAIGPGTVVADIEPLVQLSDVVTVLAVEPGKQGQTFMPEELVKVRELREGNFPGEIQVDGAITAGTIVEVAAAGPDTLVVGSYIVAGEDPRARYEELVRRIGG